MFDKPFIEVIAHQIASDPTSCGAERKYLLDPATINRVLEINHPHGCLVEIHLKPDIVAYDDEGTTLAQDHEIVYVKADYGRFKKFLENYISVQSFIN